jgi:hypothetical protein
MGSYGSFFSTEDCESGLCARCAAFGGLEGFSRGFRFTEGNLIVDWHLLGQAVLDLYFLRCGHLLLVRRLNISGKNGLPFLGFLFLLDDRYPLCQVFVLCRLMMLKVSLAAAFLLLSSLPL